MLAEGAGRVPRSLPVLLKMKTRGEAVLWVLRLGILAMISVAVAVLYHRHHLTEEQQDLLRYVEVDLVVLRRQEDPIEAGLSAWLLDQHQSRERARQQLADEWIPALIRLRRQAEAPLQAARTPPVRALAREYQEVVAGLMDACRTAVRIIDAEGDQRAGYQQIREGFAAAAERSRAWEDHVKEVSRQLRLSQR